MIGPDDRHRMEWLLVGMVLTALLVTSVGAQDDDRSSTLYSPLLDSSPLDLDKGQTSVLPPFTTEDQLAGIDQHSAFGNSNSVLDPFPFSRNKERKLFDFGSIAWSLVSASPGFSARESHSSVALDSSTIVLAGGATCEYFLNLITA